MSITELTSHIDALKGGGWGLYLKEFCYATCGLFAIDIAWRIMDNFIDYWLLVHFSGLTWLIGDK